MGKLVAGVAVVLSLALPAVSAIRAGRGPDLVTDPAGQAGAGVDGEGIRARTASIDARREADRLRYGDRIYTANLARGLAGVRARAESPPDLLGRLTFPFGAEGAVRARVQEVAAFVAELRKGLDADVVTARRYLDAQRILSPERHTELTRSLETLEERAEEARELLDEAATSFALRGGGFGGRVRLLGRQILGDDGPTALADLAEKLSEWGTERLPQVLGAELTYVKGGMVGGDLPAQSLVPAYLDGPASQIALEDLSLDREIQLSEEIRARATSLENAAAVLAFVRSATRLEWYAGCVKGSAETLRELRGNDVDLSALLIALLRAKEIPARFVRGTIELPIGRITELMGLLSAAELAALSTSGEGQVPPVARSLALQALTAAGIPFEPVIAGGQVASVRFLHTWVEAFVAFSDYRGAGLGRGAKQWIPLDPAFQGAARYTAAPPKYDALQVLGTDVAGLATQYLDGTATESPLQFVRRRLQERLEASHPGAPLEDAFRRIDQTPERVPLLAGSLPYKVVAAHSESAFLPEEALHRARVRVSDGAGYTLDVTLPLHALVGRRALLAFEPATGSDEVEIAQAGGIYSVDASTVAVRPVLRVGGERRAVGQRPVGLGQDIVWSLELLLPDGSVRQIQNSALAGNLIAIGLGGPRNGYDEASDAGEGIDGPGARFLYGVAARYVNEWTAAEEAFGELLQVVPIRPTASLVLVENQLSVDETLGIRRRVQWKGLQVDADHRTMTPLELLPGRGRDLLRLAGLEGSHLEARVLAEAAHTDAVSAVTVLQEARQRGVPVLRIAPGDAAGALRQLATSAEVLREVRDQVARGREVLVPASDLTIRDWKGSGFIARDPATEEAGYFLSGIVSGGMTVVSPQWWTDEELVAALTNANAPQPTLDQSKIARIVVMPTSNFQSAVVGQALQKPLAVRVTTMDGVPVQGAPVTFRAIGAGPELLSQSWTREPVTLMTDQYGIAAIRARPDTNILRLAIEDSTRPPDLEMDEASWSPQYLGLNEVSAETVKGTTVIVAAQRLTFLGLPDVPAQLTSQPGVLVEAAAAIEYRFPFGVTLADRFGNPIANARINWTESSTEGGFVSPWSASRRAWTLADCSGLVKCEPAPRTRTDSMGRSNVGLVTPSVEGPMFVVAETGALVAVWNFRVDPHSSFLRAHTVGDPTFGIVGLSWPGPIVVQAWESDGSSPSAVADVRITMTNTTSTGVLVDSAMALPSAVQLGRTAGYDSPETAVFWPRYVVEGPQTVSVSAELKFPGGRRAIDVISTQVVAGRPAIRAIRYPSGEPAVPARASDLAVEVKIANPSSRPLLLDVRSHPNNPAESLVVLPGADVLPRDTLRPWLILIEGPATRFIRLPLSPDSSGGSLEFEVLADDADVETGAPTEVSLEHLAVEVVPRAVVGAATAKYADADRFLEGGVHKIYYDPAAAGPGEVVALKILSAQSGAVVYSQTAAPPLSGAFEWNGSTVGSQSPVQPGTYQVVIEVNAPAGMVERSEPYPLTVFRVTVTNPQDFNHDGLVNDAEEDSAGVGNEFTFWDPFARFFGATTRGAGQLRIDCRATVSPEALSQGLRWRIYNGRDSSDATGQLFGPLGVARRWSGTPADEGRGEAPSFTMDGMPALNDDFGDKSVRVRLLDPEMGDRVLKELVVPIQVFWPKLIDSRKDPVDENFAKGHPGGDLNSDAEVDFANMVARPGTRAPNWFYYWGQAVQRNDGIALDHLRYMDQLMPDVKGMAPAMFLFPYGYEGRHDRILITQNAQGVDIPPPNSDAWRQGTTGIDAFRDTVIHEGFHGASQSVEFTNVAFGRSVNGSDTVTDADWSLNIERQSLTPSAPLPPGRRYNHFVDLNGDGDFLDPGEDLDFDGDSIPNALDPTPYVPDSKAQIEGAARRAEPDKENDMAGADWGNPGKRHRDENAWYN